MKLKLFLSLSLATALCFYGCTKTEIVEIVVPSNSTEETAPDESTDPDDVTDEDGDDERLSDPGDKTYDVTGAGTVENPYTVADALNIINNGDYMSDKVYVKGIISQIDEIDTRSNGTATYHISDDGDTENQLEIYLGYSLDGNKFTSEDEISVGDEAVVYGELTIYNSTPRMGENNYICSLIGREDDEMEDVCQYIKNAYFRDYCRDNFDTDGDGKISYAEAAAVTEISCSYAADFSGIEYFVNLQSFVSTSVKIIDLRYNAELTSVMMREAPIEQLDLSCNTKLKTIDDYTFYGCNELASIILPEDLTSIGEYAFYNCSKLTSIDLPESLIKIGSYAFYNCSKLISVRLQEGLTSIEDYAFAYCTELTSIELPERLTSLGSRAFAKCTGLTSIELPKALTSISDCTFAYCEGLTSIKLPEGLTSIGNFAFVFCSGLTSIDLPEGLTTICYCAFYDCKGLTSIDLPKELTTIKQYAFAGCSGLASINLPEELTSIESFAFCSCKGLASIDLPEGLTSIGTYAFYNCSSLSSVTSKATTPPAIGSYTFFNINSPSTLYVPSESVSAYENTDWAKWFNQILSME